MKIQLVVFDMAGTTLHDENNVHHSLQYALGKHGIKVSTEDINPLMGIPKPAAIKQLMELAKVDSQRINETVIKSIHQDFLESMLDFYQNHPAVKAKEGAEEIFEYLHSKGIKVVLDTGFSRDIVDTILDRLQWHSLVDGSVASDEVAHGRPAPDLIFKAMELSGVQEVGTVAKVGDTASDLWEGTNAGCQYVIGITTGAYSREALQKEPHTHLIEHLLELQGIIN